MPQAVILTLWTPDPFEGSPVFLTLMQLEAVVNWPPVSTVADVRSFLEFANYHRMCGKAAGLARSGSVCCFTWRPPDQGRVSQVLVDLLSLSRCVRCEIPDSTVFSGLSWDSSERLR